MADDVVWYERASPALLMEAPAEAPEPDEDWRKTAAAEWTAMRSHLEQRLGTLRSLRSSWLTHWQLIAQYINPRRNVWLTNAGGSTLPTAGGSSVRGLPINQSILDATGTYAAQVCAAGMMTGLMSPGRPWFKLKPAFDLIPLDRAGKLWFEAVEKIIYAVMQHSNFYDSSAQMLEDLVVFGTGVQLIYENEDDIVRCQNPVVGEYYLAIGESFRPEVLYRQFVLTISQLVERFGLDNCPPSVQSMWQQKGSNLDVERVVAHSLEPNFEVYDPEYGGIGKVPGGFVYREVFWLFGESSAYPLSERGFKDPPLIAPRWWLAGNDAYGRGPGMTVLGDVMQLQQETRRKAEFLEKLVRPPLNAPVSLKNQPSSTLPGSITYSDSPTMGMKPVFEMNAQAMPAITADLQEVQKRIKTGFFNDLFLMLAETTKDMTAFEVAQRQQEKLQVLGPVIERFQNEAASPAIQRIFAILRRKQMLPPVPRSLLGIPWKIEYVSMLAMAQRAAATAGIERLLKVQAEMAALDPNVLDVLDNDEVLVEYGDQLNVSQRIYRSQEDIAQRRAAKAAQARAMQQQQALQQTATETGPKLAQAAQSLSQTDVGGGQSALAAMLGQTPQTPLPGGGPGAGP